MQFNENNEKKEKNLNINNPYELNSYIKVAKPSIWILLFSVIFLIISISIWTVFGTIEDKVEAVVFIKDYKCEIYIAKKDYPRVTRGMKLNIKEHEFEIISVSNKPKELDRLYFDEDSKIENFKVYDQVYQIEVNELEHAGFTTGIYHGSIVVNVIHPISFFKI